MRKAEKKQAEEFVGMLVQAHEEIREYIEKGRVDEAKDLLEQCQQGAISLGELIEVREGEQFVTIPLLEAYCEVVYQSHEELGTSASINGNNAYKKLRKALIQISNSVRNDIRIRREVVFLPYKASMWDSLESVWKAADEDPDCDAYVIPIPYYDKNPDGSFRERHYEGDQYPQYVPITRCEDYDFAKHRPDMIFIHNPYTMSQAHPSDTSSLRNASHESFRPDSCHNKEWESRRRRSPDPRQPPSRRSPGCPTWTPCRAGILPLCAP